MPNASKFVIDWEHKQATCPKGHTSINWTPAIDNRTDEVIKIKFSTTDCGGTPLQMYGIRSEKKYKRRTITIRPQTQHEALHL
jgi:transposase